MPKARLSYSTSTQYKLMEVAMAAPFVIAHRLTRMALAGPVLTTQDRDEFLGMVKEKQDAFSKSWLSMMTEGVRFQQQLALGMFTGARPQQQSARVKRASARIASRGLAPIHRKATANAKRLARTPLGRASA